MMDLLALWWACVQLVVLLPLLAIFTQPWLARLLSGSYLAWRAYRYFQRRKEATVNGH